MIHRREEGVASRQGINWTWDKFSQPTLLLKIGRLVLYARRRSSFVMDEALAGGYLFNPIEAYKKRYIFDSGIIAKPNLSILPWKRFD